MGRGLDRLDRMGQLQHTLYRATRLCASVLLPTSPPSDMYGGRGRHPALMRKRGTGHHSGQARSLPEPQVLTKKADTLSGVDTGFAVVFDDQCFGRRYNDGWTIFTPRPSCARCKQEEYVHTSQDIRLMRRAESCK